MSNQIEGEILAGDVKLAIVVSRFNEFITKELLGGALDAFRRHGGDSEKDVTVVWVPGSLEMPVVAKALADSGKYGAVVCLGCIIQGGTSHFDCVVNGTTSGVMKASMDSGVPIIFGVLTCANLEQAIDRAGTKQGNAGAKAAVSAIEMANLLIKIKKG